MIGSADGAPLRDDPPRRLNPSARKLRGLVLLTLLAAVPLSAETRRETLDNLSAHHNPPDLSVVPMRMWDDIDRSVDRSLRYLVSQQNPDGSIRTLDSAKPAVTSLVVMALLSAGHQPGCGPYGENINHAVDFVISTQMDDGLFSYLPPTNPVTDWTGPTHLAIYNHGISGLMLGEVYGMTDPQRALRVKPCIEKSLVWLRNEQQRAIPSGYEYERGGWRYIEQPRGDRYYSDTSVTSWQIMLLRSAHNAGFKVPQEWVDQAVDYTERCFDKSRGAFKYSVKSSIATRGTTGAGVVSLFLAGRYDDEIERRAGQWLLGQEFTRFNRSRSSHDRYFYACYYCSQAAYQLGGEYWARTYPPMARTLVDNQRPDGSWTRDHRNPDYGSQYSTSMAALALTPPYQLLPIYQR